VDVDIREKKKYQMSISLNDKKRKIQFWMSISVKEKNIECPFVKQNQILDVDIYK